LSVITSKFRTVAMFVIPDLLTGFIYILGMFIIHLHTKCRIPISSGPLVIPVKPKAK
jgi:hypothetical protein